MRHNSDFLSAVSEYTGAQDTSQNGNIPKFAFADPSDGLLSTLKKTAGIDITNPTIDEIERYVKAYTDNELGGILPFSPNSDVVVIPTAMRSGPSGDIEDASIVVHFNVAGQKIELPSVFMRGEFIPFDTIMIGSRRIPYSRENIKKLVSSLIQEKEKGNVESGAASVGANDKAPSLNPYLSVESPAITPASSFGPLGNVLQFRNRFGQRGRSNQSGDPAHGGMYTYATVDVQEILGLCKEAQQIVPGHVDEIVRELTNSIDTHQIATEQEHLKMALQTEFEETDKVIEKQAALLNATGWRQVNDLENGTYVSIPVVKYNESPGTPEVTMVSGLVLRDLNLFGAERALVPGVPDPSTTTTVVITADHHMVILKNEDRMLVLPETTPSFQLKATPINALGAKDTFIYISGNVVFYPAQVRDINRVTFHGGKKPHSVGSVDRIVSLEDSVPAFLDTGLLVDQEKIFEIQPLFSTGWAGTSGWYPQDTSFEEGTGYPEDGGDFFRGFDFPVPLLRGAHFDVMSYLDFTSKKAEQLCLDPNEIPCVLPESRVVGQVRDRKNEKYYKLGVRCTDPDTGVIRISGMLTGFFKTMEDLELLTIRDAGTSSFELLKSAGDLSELDLSNMFKLAKTEESVEVRLKHRGKEGSPSTYDITVRYVDKTQKLFAGRTKTLSDLEEYQAKGILKALQFEQSRVSQLMQNAKTQNFAVADLPAGAKPDELRGGEATGPLQSAFSNIKNVVFAPKVKEALAVNVAKAVIGELAGSVNSGALESAAADYDALSEYLEKVAVVQEMKEMQETAAWIKVASVLHAATARTLDSDAISPYPLFKVAEKVSAHVPHLEDLCDELLTLRREQLAKQSWIMDDAAILKTAAALSQLADLADACEWTAKKKGEPHA